MGSSGAPTVAKPEDAPEVILGVERSVSGKRWLSRPFDMRTALAMAQRLAVPEVVGRVLAGRGVTLDQADDFLNPTLRAALPDPSRLADMEVGAARLAEAVCRGEPVAVFADYDVDGATSAALLARFFAALGRPLRLYVPDRLNEGYGPTAEALLQLHREGIAVVVTVDCGTTAHEALRAAAEAGLDVIVVDHHAVEATLPPAAAVINPNRTDDISGQGHLAAVGVTFLLVVALNRALRARGFYADQPEPDLRQWLDLVALGTLCDLASLKGVNRALVVQGLKVMAQWTNQGLKALAAIAGLDAPPGTYHAGFVFGPRINAAGRVGEAGLGARLLASTDGAEAADMARRLDLANRARREIEAAVLQEALTQIAMQPVTVSGVTVLMAAGQGWHPGVVGIVASRLVERFNYPACVVALRDGIGTGSGRSIAGANLGAAVIAAQEAGLLRRGGGHAMAAGFSVEEDRLDDLRAFLVERLAGAVQVATSQPILHLDGTLAVGGALPSLSAVVARAGPFGMGNPEPRFAIPAARILHTSLAQGGHVRCVLGDSAHTRLSAIAFRCADGPIGQTLLRNRGAPMHIAGRLREDGRGGKQRVQLQIDDIAPVTAE
jgi:single-stranded-DNA-specific exonuclease